jgi:hypothetical protein
MHADAVFLIVLFGISLIPLGTLVLVVRMWPKLRTGDPAQRVSLDKLKQLELPDVILFVRRLVAVLVIGAITIATVIGLFALVLFWPIMSCHGEGSGGNCGEGFLASIPLALLLIPLDIVAAFYVCKFLTFWYWPEASPSPPPT